MKPYPICFTPILLPKVWGGRRLAAFGRELPGDESVKIGESWELADLGATSASGAGGGAARTLIGNGDLAGKTLGQAMTAWGPGALGRLQLDEHGQFPLLVKLIDASENLSVQVHPSADYCARHGGVFLKNEAWYIVAAEPGAVIYKGLADGVTLDALREACVEAAKTPGRSAKLEAMFKAQPVKAGDLIYLASGDCHALGAGVVVAEVQTPSDTTFRLYDWGRTGRQLHIEESIESIRTFVPPDRSVTKRSHIAGVFTTVTRLVTSDDFQIEKVRMAETYRQEIPYDQPTVWVVLEGAGTVSLGKNGRAGKYSFGKGQTWLFPAGLEEPWVEFSKDTVWLEVTFPSAMPVRIA
jgi:mannose-6-phosphate isomerase